MPGLADGTLLATVALGSVRGAGGLLRAQWPRRCPAAAILLWQALGLAGGIAAVGALIAFGVATQGAGVAGGLIALVTRITEGHLTQPGQPAILTIGEAACLAAGTALLLLLCWVLVVASAAVLQARRRQLALLALLAHGDPKVPGALVVDHPAAAAYCLPGLRSAIVVSVGTLDLLGPAELAAVLAHERAHLRARHDLVLLPFTSLRRAFPRSRVVRQSQRAVALLIEMLADDRARRAMPARELATALLRFGTAGAGCPPSGAVAAGALAAAEGEISARVNRLLTPPAPLSRRAQATVCLAAVLLVAAPVALLVIP
jgi:hypothetical protein